MRAVHEFAGHGRAFLIAAVLFLLCLPSRTAECQVALPGPRITIDLSGAVAEALVNNPSLRENRLEWLIRQARERGAWGAFEPALVAGYSKSGTYRMNSASQRSSLLGRPEYDEDKGTLNLGLTGKVVTGAAYDLGFSLSDTTSDLSPDKEFESSFGGSIAQPLLKGITRQAALADIRAARLDTLVAFHTYRRQLISMVASAETAYWDLELAEELADLAAKSVDIATRVHADSELRVSVGKMSAIDLAEAKSRLDATAADREQKVQAAEEAGLRLRLVLSSPRMLTAQGVVSSRAVEAFLWDAGRFQTDHSSAVAEALLYQPDVAIKKAELERERLLLDLRRDQRLPELNARASCFFQGLGSSPEESLRILSGQQYPTWSLGIELRIPILGDIKGGQAVEEYQLRKKIIQGQLESAERETEVAVRGLLLRAAAAGALVESAGAVAAFKQRQLDEELLRFEAGKSDVRKLLEFESALSEARAAELGAVNKLRKALTDLAATSGTILRDKGLETLEGGLFLLDSELLKID